MSKFGIAAIVLTATLVVGLVYVASQGGDPTPDLAAVTVGAEPTSTASTVEPTTTRVLATTTEPQTTSSSIATTTTSTTVATTPTTASTTSTVAPTSSAAPTTTAPQPAFSVTVSTPTESRLSSSWRPGCPVDVADLRLLRLSHWGYDGKARTGELVVAANQVGAISAVFEILFAERFPIERMELVEEYGGDDNASMSANNTSAFNCRQVTGGSSFSEHSYGRAIDINPLVNPYVNGSTVAPAGGARYTDRSLDSPGMIHGGDEVVRAFADFGWSWGGNWTSLKDYQHFSSTGR